MSYFIKLIKKNRQKNKKMDNDKFSNTQAKQIYIKTEIMEGGYDCQAFVDYMS